MEVVAEADYIQSLLAEGWLNNDASGIVASLSRGLGGVKSNFSLDKLPGRENEASMTALKQLSAVSEYAPTVRLFTLEAAPGAQITSPADPSTR